MKLRLKRPSFLIVVTAIVAVGATIVSLVVLPHGSQAHFHTRDNAYQFRFAELTRGTNHLIFSGNSAVAKLKWAIYRSPLRPVCRWFPQRIRAQFYSASTSTNTSVLWIGWTHKAYTYTMTNGIPYSSQPELVRLHCYLTGFADQSMRLITSVEAPLAREFVGAWALPTNLTNLAGCTVHLKQYGGSEDVTTLQLQ